HEGNLDQRLTKMALDAAFGEPEAHTAAFVALHRGHIVAERYAPGFSKDTQLESWSMGKSLTATLIGLLINQGDLALSDPAPIAEWQQAGDPRKEVRIEHLLRMSSGLKCSGKDQTRADW